MRRLLVISVALCADFGYDETPIAIMTEKVWLQI